MSYTKTNWQTGDTITAEKLNHAEQGIYDNSTSGGGVLIVHDVNGTLDKTWNEILEAEYSVVTAYDEGTEQGEPYKERDYYIVQTIYGRGELYSVSISGGMSYHSDNPDGYPSTTLSGEGEG